MSAMKNKNYWGITAILGAAILVVGVFAVAPVQEAFSLGHLKKAGNNDQAKPAYNANSGVENLGPVCVTEQLESVIVERYDGTATELSGFIPNNFVVTTCLEKEIKTFNNYGVITVVEIEDVKRWTTHFDHEASKMETVGSLTTITCTKTIDQKAGTMTKDPGDCNVETQELNRVRVNTSVPLPRSG